MADEPSTSSAPDPLGVASDVQSNETEATLKRLHRKLNDHRLEYVPIDKPLLRAEFLTGLHVKVLEDMAQSDFIKFSDIEPLERNHILTELHKFYLDRNILPTTKQLFDAVLEAHEYARYIDLDLFRKLLVLEGFVWKHLKDWGFVVMERPRVTFERYNYLKKIKALRAEDKPIVFIDEFIVSCCHGPVIYSLYNKPKVRSNDEKFVHVLYGISALGIHGYEFYTRKEEQNCFNYWVSHHLDHLPPSMVIVLPNTKDKHFMEEVVPLPGPDTVKADIYKWLDYHNVSYRQNMSKAELIRLAEKTTDMKRIYKEDEFLKIKGYQVLRMPESLKDISPAHYFRKTVINNILKPLRQAGTFSIEKLNKGIENFKTDFFVNIGQCASKQEEKVIARDLKVDDVIDELCDTMEQHVPPDYDSDLPPFDDDFL